MGIYSNLINFESAAVQDPDNTGVDLDQVEDAVMGDDGIEAHKDEVEAAIAGTVDPVEEAYTAIYEAEYNYNQIMRTIGIRELSEAAYGREIVLEGADIKGFFNKCKEFFVAMFKKITEAFKNVGKILMSSIASDKSLASKYANDIKAGFDGTWSATGYVFNPNIALENVYDYCNKYDSDRIKAVLDGMKRMSDITADDSYYNKVSKEEIMSKVAEKLNLGDVNSDKEYREALTKHLRSGNDKPVELNGKISYDQIIKNLKNDSEVKDIKKAYDDIKKSFNKTLTDLKTLEKAVYQETGDNATKNKRIAYVSGAIASMKNIKSVESITYSVTLNAAKQKRAQARKMALYFIRHSKSTKKTTNATQESAGIFGNLEMI